jgi:hypothetical protein
MKGLFNLMILGRKITEDSVQIAGRTLVWGRRRVNYTGVVPQLELPVY